MTLTGRHSDRVRSHVDPSHVRKTIDQMNEQLAAEGKAPFQAEDHSSRSRNFGVERAPADEIAGHYCENCHVGNIVPDDGPITAISG
jgi:hypothetical protein